MNEATCTEAQARERLQLVSAELDAMMFDEDRTEEADRRERELLDELRRLREVLFDQPSPAEIKAYHAAQDHFDTAIARHDKREAYAAAARLLQVFHPNEPVDIARARHVARFYAGDVYGWQMEP